MGAPFLEKGGLAGQGSAWSRMGPLGVEIRHALRYGREFPVRTRVVEKLGNFCGPQRVFRGGPGWVAAARRYGLLSFPLRGDSTTEAHDSYGES